MKIINILIVVISLLLYSCTKETLPYPANCTYCNLTIGDCYIGNNLNALFVDKRDSVNELSYIKLNFSGKLVSKKYENYSENIYMMPYFINEIKKIDIRLINDIGSEIVINDMFITNSIDYSENINLDNIINKPLGFSPRYLYLRNNSDTLLSGKIIIEIVDIYNNSLKNSVLINSL